MDNQTAAGVIAQSLNTFGPMAQALQVAATILQKGYASDIASARTAIQPETDALTSQVADLTSELQTEKDAHAADNASKDQQIADLTAQLAAVNPQQ